MNRSLDARALAARTPRTRNRYIDLLRVLSIAVVVVGHWLMAVITIDAAGAIRGDNVLGLVPWLQYLTWGLQVMPIFFIVGGYANASSWLSARARGSSYADWVRSRMARLLRPTLVFAGVWTALTLVFAHVVRLDPATLRVGMMLVAVPVWFLAVYLLVIPLVPAMVRLHGRFGVGVPIGLAAAAAVIDLVVRNLGVVGIGYLNYLFVWLAVHQLGLFWRDGRTSGRAQPPTLAGLGLGGLITLSGLGWYSRSLLGVPGEQFGNTQPPTIMLIAVALFQFGIILLLEAPVRRWLERERVWVRVVAANGLAMTVYLWHLPAMAFGVLLARATGIGLRGEPLTAGWWIARPMWVGLLVLLTAPLVAIFSRLEPVPSGTSAFGGAAAAVAGSLAAAVGLGLLALGGFYNQDGFLALAVVPLALLSVGAALLGQVGGLRPARR